MFAIGRVDSFVRLFVFKSYLVNFLFFFLVQEIEMFNTLTDSQKLSANVVSNTVIP